jgi:uncharacterized repeat protein (TIGR01451 family)
MSGLRRIGRPQSGSARKARTTARPRLELLEERALLATFTVTNTADTSPSGAIVAGSFRDAVNKSNSTPGLNTIKFNIAGNQPHTIGILSAMLPITNPVTIDATTQPGYAGTPVIFLDGTSAGANVSGLTFSVGGSSLMGMDIGDFKADGVVIEQGQVSMTGCVIGGDFKGTSPRPNGGDGIRLQDASACTIGGAAAGARNIIVANGSAGIGLVGNDSTANIIQGNYIGIDASGTRALGNTFDGIDFNGGAFNQVGGSNVGEGNVISGNGGNGITLFAGGATANAIQGNFIGTDSTGMFGVGNKGDGIGIIGAPNNQIGAPNPPGTPAGVLGSGNVISANSGNGIGMVGGDNTVVQNNFIGADLSGAPSLGNLGAGVSNNGGNNLLVGGTLAGAGNVVADNGKTFNAGGVNIFSGNGATIESNSIFSNFGLGITNANFSNAPNVTLAGTGAGRTKILGSFSNAPNTTYFLQFFANNPTDPNGFSQGHFLLGSQNITTDSNGTGTIDVTLNTPSQVGQYVTATLTDPLGNTTQFSAPQPIVKSPISNLSMVLTSSLNPATLGNNFTYTATITNNGPDTATNVVFNDTLPAGLTFVTSSPNVTQNGSTISGNLGSLNQGQSATVTITVSPTVTGTVKNTATSDSDAINPNTSNSTATVAVQVEIPTDLAVTINPQPSPVTVGSNLTYIDTVTDNGPGPATGVTLTDTLPGNVSIVTVDPGQGTYTQTGNVVTFKLGSLATGVSTAVRIVVTPGATATSVVNTATVSGDEIDTNPLNNTTSTTTTVVPAADLGVTLTGSPNPVVTSSGSVHDLTYTAVVTNNGPSPATGVTLVAPLPPGVTFVKATGPNSPPGGYQPDPKTGKLTFNIGTLALGGTTTVTYEVTPSGSGTLTDTITASANETDPNMANNTATATTLVNPADLTVSIATSPTPARSNQPVVYTITVTNNGPSDATNATVTDAVPAGLALVGGPSVSQGLITVNGGGKIVANLGTIPFSRTATLTISVLPTQTGEITDTATVAGDQVDSNTSNNTASVNTFVDPADLSVTMTPSSSQIILGEPTTYTITVVNNGPVTATNVNVIDTLPAGVTVGTTTASQGHALQLGGTVVAALGSMAHGATATVRISLVPTSGTGTTVINTVTVTGDQIDPNTGNNTATSSLPVVSLPGSIQFAQPVFNVKENAGTATVTVVRTGGTAGALAVNYAVINGTGADGVNFHSTSGTLTFQNGQASATFTVQVLDDGIEDGDHTATLLLGAVGGTTLGPLSTAALNIQNADVDLVGPTVQDVQVLGTGGAITGLVVTFSKPLDPTRASNPANYFLAAPSIRTRTSRVAGGPVGIASVAYTPGGTTVLITPGQALGAGVFYELAINGSAQTGIDDVFGNVLNSNGNTGQPASNYVATFARGSNLSYTDSGGNGVNLRLTGGGVIDMFRSGSGDAQVVRLVGVLPGVSTLNGSVRKLAPNSTGVTTLGSLEGLGTFGAVRSRLRTPPFEVGQQTALAPSILLSPFTHRPTRRFRHR